MDRSWKIYVADLCSDAWGLSSRRIQKVIEGIEVLIATDQLSDFALAGILSSVAEPPVPAWPRLDSEMPHPGP